MDIKTANSKLKETYGWSKQLEEQIISLNPALRNEFNGHFRLKKHKGTWFWYYNLSTRVKGREKYLCSVTPKDLEPNQTSFNYAVNILQEKLRSKFVMGIRNKSYLHTYIVGYKDFLEDDNVLTQSVVNGRRNTIDRFGSWIKRENIRLNIVPTNDMKDVYIKYIKYLQDKGLMKSSIKAQLQIVRYFLDWLCKDKRLGGAEFFPSHPITQDFQNDLLSQIKREPSTKKIFKKSYFEQSYIQCNKKIQQIWQRYCENDGRLDRIRDKNGKINQAPHMIGRDVVYFISFLQLRAGFRVSEVLYSYRNVDVYNNFHIPNLPNEMASYWEKTEDGWVIQIIKSKNKDRSVPFPDTIRSWKMPPSEEILKVSKCTYDKKGEPLHWDTPFIDVCIELFPDSYYLFPSPNQKNHSNSKRSKTYYMNEFKFEMVLKNEWDKFGIQGTHDLRRFFISHSISNNTRTPFEISRITGHNINTMEKFYIRDNMADKFKHFTDLSQKDLLNSTKKK